MVSFFKPHDPTDFSLSTSLKGEERPWVMECIFLSYEKNEKILMKKKKTTHWSPSVFPQYFWALHMYSTGNASLVVSKGPLWQGMYLIAVCQNLSSGACAGLTFVWLSPACRDPSVTCAHSSRCLNWNHLYQSLTIMLCVWSGHFFIYIEFKFSNMSFFLKVYHKGMITVMRSCSTFQFHFLSYEPCKQLLRSTHWQVEPVVMTSLFLLELICLTECSRR